MCVYKCVSKLEKKEDRTGAAARERPWVMRKGEVGCADGDGGADERTYTSGVAGREAEKGSLIASECKRFGVRWDTGSQSGGRAG